MSDQKVFNNSLEMKQEERKSCSVLAIDPVKADREKMLSAFEAFGFGHATAVESYAIANKILKERRFSHLIFYPKNADIPIENFLQRVIADDSDLIPIVSAEKPDLNEVFDLLVLGVRGYLVKPFCADSVEHAILMATKGGKFSETILNAPDRTKMLIAIMLNNLDRAAQTLKESEKFVAAEQELPKVMASLSQSVDIARALAKGGESNYLERSRRYSNGEKRRTSEPTRSAKRATR